MEQMEGQIKRLGFERESIQRKIEKYVLNLKKIILKQLINLFICIFLNYRLEAENDNLKGKHVAHSHQLQNEYISLPNDVMVI